MTAITMSGMPYCIQDAPAAVEDLYEIEFEKHTYILEKESKNKSMDLCIHYLESYTPAWALASLRRSWRSRINRLSSFLASRPSLILRSSSLDATKLSLTFSSLNRCSNVEDSFFSSLSFQKSVCVWLVGKCDDGVC